MLAVHSRLFEQNNIRTPFLDEKKAKGTQTEEKIQREAEWMESRWGDTYLNLAAVEYDVLTYFICSSVTNRPNFLGNSSAVSGSFARWTYHILRTHRISSSEYCDLPPMATCGDVEC